MRCVGILVPCGDSAFEGAQNSVFFLDSLRAGRSVDAAFPERSPVMRRRGLCKQRECRRPAQLDLIAWSAVNRGPIGKVVEGGEGKQEEISRK